jgi:hypothetical protein
MKSCLELFETEWFTGLLAGMFPTAAQTLEAFKFVP